MKDKSCLIPAVCFILGATMMIYGIIGLNRNIKDLVNKYQQPDTTIKCVNGKCDTVIIIKTHKF